MELCLASHVVDQIGAADGELGLPLAEALDDTYGAPERAVLCLVLGCAFWAFGIS